MTLPILAITSGEPAGIGPDICLDLAQAGLPCRCVVSSRTGRLKTRYGKANWKCGTFLCPTYAKQAV